MRKDMAVIADIKGEMHEVSPRRSLSGKDLSAYVYQKYLRPYQTGGRIPKAYPTQRFERWDKKRGIGTIPSISARELTTGVERTLSPQSPSIMNDVNTRSSRELQDKTVQPQNQKEFRAYDPRAHPTFAKMAYDRLRLLPQIARRNRMLSQHLLKKAIERRRVRRMHTV